MDIGITKMSTKGQIVIPSDMRKEFKVGEKLVVIKEGHRLIIKKASKMSKQMMEDIEFARRTEEAYKRHERGEFKTTDSKDFLKELKKWQK